MGLLTCLSLGFLFAAFSLKGVEADCCPMEWLPLQGNCYRIFPTKMAWNAAATACRKQFRGCNLASIHDQQEAAELAKYVTKYRPDSSNVWIGLHDPQKNRQWRWIDNSPVLYVAWNPGEPNNLRKDENCVELWSQSGYKKWNDVNCGQQRPYLCKFKL